MNIAIGAESDRGGRMMQVICERPGASTWKRACTWASLMYKLSDTTLRFRFFDVGDRDDRDAAAFVRSEYGWGPW